MFTVRVFSALALLASATQLSSAATVHVARAPQAISPSPSAPGSAPTPTGTVIPVPTNGINITEPSIYVDACFPIGLLPLNGTSNTTYLPVYVQPFNLTGYLLGWNVDGSNIPTNVTTAIGNFSTISFPNITSIPSTATWTGTANATWTLSTATGAAPQTWNAGRRSLSVRVPQVPVDGSAPVTSPGTGSTAPAPVPSGTVPVIATAVPSPVWLPGQGEVATNATVPSAGYACFFFPTANQTGCIPLCGAGPQASWNGTQFVVSPHGAAAGAFVYSSVALVAALFTPLPFDGNDVMTVWGWDVQYKFNGPCQRAAGSSNLTNVPQDFA
ncbi:hypothetical protein BKA62DRAFT_758953 [Auriculariales sp. MPI-PUGE-AT-0066]|nr:hypothetical protein BKA62DRAFT_758953 [Auriculariales sp. MPI-PUGE-AT-0066]